MYSSWRRTQQVVWSVGLMGVLAATGCGHKAPPFPPPAENPARTTDLTIAQRGTSAILTFSFPQTTIAGEVLPPLTKIEIWQLERPFVNLETGEVGADEDEAAEEGEAPTEEGLVSEPVERAPKDLEEKASDRATDEDAEGDTEEDSDDESSSEEPLRLEEIAAPAALEFIGGAQLVETLDADAIERAGQGPKLIFRRDLGEAGNEERVLTFAIKSFTSSKLGSSFSNLATLVQRTTPPAPGNFTADGEGNGVRLSWSLDGLSDFDLEGFHVYRRASDSRTYDAPLTKTDSDSTEYLDRTAAYGERYIYAVTAVGNLNPVVESYFGGEREIDYADRFAPKPPTNLVALADDERVRVLWDASKDDDVVGYIVFRRVGEAEFLRLTDEPILGVEYSDRSIASATTYDYRVAAVDRAGNQGEQSKSVIARVP